jgi:septal ring factor EnvC (AmiA/AmiB activator)
MGNRLTPWLAGLLCMGLLTGAKSPAIPRPTAKPQTPPAHKAPPNALPSVEPLSDLSLALSAPVAAGLPSTAEQFRQLKGAIIKSKPAVDTAKAQSERLQAQATALRQKLIETASRVQALEKQKIVLEEEIQSLSAQYVSMSARFMHDRAAVARLLAVIERLQHDTPPAMALRPDDALGAARGAMLIGASLPQVYGEAAAVARQIEQLRHTRDDLFARRADAVRNAGLLRTARADLDQLLATKQRQAASAEVTYGALKSRLDAIASQAADLKTLLAKVADLRSRPAEQSVVLVTARNAVSGALRARGTLLLPVVGTPRPAGTNAGHTPGVTFVTAPGAQVVAPADCEVLFAGPYHKNGQVLILEVTAGYDLVLAGLDRIMVRPGDLILAGEPVGAMPQMGQDGELYFELRQNGRSANPGPLLGLDLRKAKRS